MSVTKQLSVTATKAEIREAHKQKMDRKKAEAALHAEKPTRTFRVAANLSRRHRKYGTHPRIAY